MWPQWATYIGWKNEERIKSLRINKTLSHSLIVSWLHLRTRIVLILFLYLVWDCSWLLTFLARPCAVTLYYLGFLHFLYYLQHVHSKAPVTPYRIELTDSNGQKEFLSVVVRIWNVNGHGTDTQHFKSIENVFHQTVFGFHPFCQFSKVWQGIRYMCVEFF